MLVFRQCLYGSAATKVATVAARSTASVSIRRWVMLETQLPDMIGTGVPVRKEAFQRVKQISAGNQQTCSPLIPVGDASIRVEKNLGVIASRPESLKALMTTQRGRAFLFGKKAP